MLPAEYTGMKSVRLLINGPNLTGNRLYLEE